MITSKDNAQLKEIRRLVGRRRAREREGRFVAEGEDLLAAADRAGATPVIRLAAAGSGLAGEEVEPALLHAVSELGSGTRTLAVYEERWAEAPALPLCVYLHGVGDPGNVGTVLRSAHAFGASSVAIGPGTADPFGPKAVRASMGAVFEVELARVHLPAVQLPRPRVALVTGAGGGLDDLLFSHANLLMIGSERDGLPTELVQTADKIGSIPIARDSLNAAMAATVVLYEASRRMARE